MNDAITSPCAWIFQANPKQFDLVRELEARSIGEVDWWNASQRHEWMRPGDIVLLWASGKQSGAYAVGVLTSEAFEQETSDVRADAEAFERAPWRVEFRYVAILLPPVLRSDILRDPALQSLTIVRSPQGTNFRVDATLWPALRARLAEALARGGRGDLAHAPDEVADLQERMDAARGAKRTLASANSATPSLGEQEAEQAGEDGDGDERLSGLGPMPGGVREYKNTLDALLAWVAAGERTDHDLIEHLRARYGTHGRRALTMYVGRPIKLGLVARIDGRLQLTDDGSAYLNARSPRALFERMHARYRGMLEVLELAASPEGCTTERALELLNDRLQTAWRTNNQPSFRRNWLLSMGLTDRNDDIDRVTELGREVLRAHDVAVANAAPTFPMVPPEDTPSSAPTGEPAGWSADRLDLSAGRIAPHIGDLRVSDRVLAQIAAALSTGKHLLLIGPPGTGKTELARAVANAARAEGYCRGLFVSTASADWSTFETLGGYAMERDQSLVFRPGVFLRALAQHQWLLVDELNRADVDRAFGELLTLLAGAPVDTPFVDQHGRAVSLGFDREHSYFVAPSFRVIATMNTWDRSSLFRLSYALLRRFAVVTVDVPDETTYHALVDHAALREGFDPPIDGALAARVKRLFSHQSLLRERALGPALALDLVRYLRRRGGTADALAEGFEMFVLPQLDGLVDEAVRRVEQAVLAAVGDVLSDEARAQLVARVRELGGGVV